MPAHAGLAWIVIQTLRAVKYCSEVSLLEWRLLILIAMGMTGS